ncbi:MAG: hypothetical protein R3F30_09420 [Planctomycetota bacterium]
MVAILSLAVPALVVMAWRFTRETWDPLHAGYGLHGQLVQALAHVLPPAASMPLGLDPANLLSILGLCVALTCFHLANRLHGSHGKATLFLSVLFLVTPAVLAQALLPTPMGPFLATVGIAYFSASAMVTRPSVGVATLFGLATGLGTLLHWCGLLTPALFLPWVMWRNRELFGDIYPRFMLAFHALLVHGMTCFAASLIDPRFNGLLVRVGHGVFVAPDGPTILELVVGQVLIPYFPLVLAFVPALRQSTRRGRFLVLAAAAAPFVLFAAADGGRTMGPGALLLPVAMALLLWIREDLSPPILGAGSFVALLFAVNLAMHPPVLDHDAGLKTRLRPLSGTSIDDLALPTGLAPEPPARPEATAPAGAGTEASKPGR